MKFVCSDKINEKAGDYLILADYGSEGLAVHSQHKTAEDAIKNLGKSLQRETLVKLVEFNISEHS